MAKFGQEIETDLFGIPTDPAKLTDAIVAADTPEKKQRLTQAALRLHFANLPSRRYTRRILAAR